MSALTKKEVETYPSRPPLHVDVGDVVFDHFDELSYDVVGWVEEEQDTKVFLTLKVVPRSLSTKLELMMSEIGTTKRYTKVGVR